MARAEKLEGDELEATKAIYHAYLVAGWRYADRAEKLLQRGFTVKGVRYLTDNVWRHAEQA